MCTAKNGISERHTMELLLPTEGNMNDDGLALEHENTQASVAMELETPQSMAAPTAQKQKLQDPEKDGKRLQNITTTRTKR